MPGFYVDMSNVNATQAYGVTARLPRWRRPEGPVSLSSLMLAVSDEQRDMEDAASRVAAQRLLQGDVCGAYSQASRAWAHRALSREASLTAREWIERRRSL